jgi:hypothetical protein
MRRVAAKLNDFAVLDMSDDRTGVRAIAIAKRFA